MHNFFFGVEYDYSGLKIKPCVPEAFGNCKTDFTYLGKSFTIEFRKSTVKEITVNGKKVGSTETFVADNDMKESNLITVAY